MKNKKLVHTVVFFFLINVLFSQQEKENNVLILNDISDVSAPFEDAFYDALNYRLIDRNEKAIQSIDRCISINNLKPVLYFEKGLNYFQLKAYEKAQRNFEVALKKMPKNEILLINLQKSYFFQQKYDETIVTLRKLVSINPKHQKLLAQAYIYTEQYGESLKVLDSYQSAFGYDTSIESLRDQIYSTSKNKTDIIAHLEKTLDKSPKNENAYVKLINVYKKLNKPKEALKVLTRFKNQMPNSPLMEYLTFKDYLSLNKTLEATKIMKRLTDNDNISDDLKKKILNDYRAYDKQNSNFTAKLNDIQESTTLSKENKVKFFMELSDFQLAKGSTESLLKIYEDNLNIDPNNFNLIKDTLPLLLYYGKNQKANKLVTSAIEKYPSQPFLYLISGHLLSKEGKHKKAISSYEEGLDYVVENLEYERTLYLKMAASYEALGMLDKAKKYQSKGEKISIE